jgi:phospholipase/carboxylesterase
MSLQPLDAVIIGPDNADYCVIWLHGLGADGYDFEPIVPELDFSQKSRTRFVFPHAPSRPVTLNQGYIMPAWYDIVAINEQAAQDEAGIRESATQIVTLLEREQARGVKTANIILAGFSQGGAIALHVALRYPHRLGGLLALSTYLPLAESLAAEAAAENLGLPIFMAHGRYDPVVPLKMAEASHQRLVEQGYRVDWRVYPMEHSVLPDEIADISDWLATCFG